MNRRTVLQAVGIGGVTTLAGCIDGVREHFTGELRSPIHIVVENEGEQFYNVRLEAHSRDDQRQTYLQDITIRSGERAGPGPLDGIEQRFRIVRLDDDQEEELVEQVIVTPETLHVHIKIYDDDIEIDAPSRDEVDEEEAEFEEAINETSERTSEEDE